MNHIERIIQDMPNKTLVFWGAGRRLKSFIHTYCIDSDRLPMPNFICDSTREIKEDNLFGVETISFDAVKQMDCNETIIIHTAGLLDLQAQVIPNEFYYFPIFHCRSFEAYFFLKDHSGELEKTIDMLADEKSKSVYRKVFDNYLNGTLWDQSLYEGHAYFGNDLIDKFKDGDHFAFAGAFNGKHLIRALKNNPNIKISAFEPNETWFNFLENKFEEDNRVKIYNRILWDKETTLGFDGDEFNSGLDAHVSEGDNFDFMVQSINMDSLEESKDISFIALDVEGSEAKALLGASNIIKTNKPILTICLYHNLIDFIELPQLIDKLGEGQYEFKVKQHSCVSAIETVLYAIPKA